MIATVKDVSITAGPAELGRPQLGLAKVEAAAGVVTKKARAMAKVAWAATLVDGADKESSITTPDGRSHDLDFWLPDKTSVFNPLKERARWGRYAGSR